MKQKLSKKKGQLSLADAPTVVLLVGLVFLVMATIAFIGEKYQDAFTANDAFTVNNETFSTVNNLTAVTANSAQACNFDSFAVVAAYNESGVIGSGNYTADSAAGTIIGTSDMSLSLNGTDWNVTYTYASAGASCNVTADLQTEIGNNTSIAGIVLTISLVGIVLTVLISIFLGIRTGQRGV